MVVYTPGTLPKVVGQEIYSLMETCDNDFVPPLSSRSQIGQENWTECAASASVDRPPILAKTWSTNKASMSVLGQHGTPLARVPADRGLGIERCTGQRHQHVCAPRWSLQAFKTI